MNSWYKAVWKRSNRVWDKFMQEYVFSSEPSFKIEKATKVLLPANESRPDLDLEMSKPFIQYVGVKDFDEETIHWMFDKQGRRTGFCQVLIMTREEIEKIWGKGAV